MSACKVLCGSLLIALQVITFRAACATQGPSAAVRASCSGERIVSTVLAGVPAILRIPAQAQKPPIVLWHGFGPPASEQALMQALPLDEVPAVKVYLGLPLFGKRAPPPSWLLTNATL